MKRGLFLVRNEAELPDLAERVDDIILLAFHILHRYAKKYQITPPALSRQDKNIMLKAHWKSNVRELENVIHRFVIFKKVIPHC